MAMAIFGLLLAAIYASWTLILKSTQIGQEAAARVQRERITMRMIKEALAGVLSFQADPYNYAFIAENENNGYLSFAARLPESFPRSSRPAWDGFDVRRVTFSIEPGADYSQRQLVLRQNPLLKEMHPDERDFPFVVSKDVNKMEFEFWDNQKRDWISEWTRTNELPRMLKIKVEFVRRNPREKYAQPKKVELVDVFPLPATMVPTIYQGPPSGQPGGGPGPGGGQGSQIGQPPPQNQPGNLPINNPGNNNPNFNRPNPNRFPR